MAPVTARQLSAYTTAPIGDRFTDAQFHGPQPSISCRQSVSRQNEARRRLGPPATTAQHRKLAGVQIAPLCGARGGPINTVKPDHIGGSARVLPELPDHSLCCGR